MPEKRIVFSCNIIKVGLSPPLLGDEIIIGHLPRITCNSWTKSQFSYCPAYAGRILQRDSSDSVARQMAKWCIDFCMGPSNCTEEAKKPCSYGYLYGDLLFLF